MDLRLEVWDRPGTAGFGRKISTLDTLQDSARLQPVNGIGEGRASIPETFTRTPEILTSDPVNPANNVRSLIRVYLDGQTSGIDPPYVEWLPESIVPPAEAESGTYEISGFGREVMVRDAIVEPWDWDGEPEFTSDWPDWVYGGRDVVGPLETNWSPHIINLYRDAAATGNFDLGISINGAAIQTANILTTDTAFLVEQKIEALAYGMTVDVQGTGVAAAPWQIRFQDPPGNYSITVSSTGLTGGRAYFDQAQYGRLLPVGWTPSRVGSTTIEHGILNDFRASLGGGSDPALPAGCDAWLFFDGQDYLFPGVQRIVRVTPNAPYWSPPIWLYSQTATAVRVVLRDLNENLIGAEEITLAAATPTLTTGIGLVMIPDGVHELVYRIGHIGTGDPGKIGVACPSLTEGFPASTIGKIVRDLYEDWTLNHVASTFPLDYWVHGDGGHYLTLDFDDALDSDGAAWPRDEKITIKRGMRFERVLGMIAALGYEWRVFPGAVDGYWVLQIFAAPTMGNDYGLLNSPTIRGGRDVTRRSIRRWLARTGALVEGADQFFAHSRNATAAAAWGMSTEYVVQQDFEPEATAVAAYVKVDSQIRRTRSLVIHLVDVQNPSLPIPGFHYVPGDTVRVIDPPLLDFPERIWSLSYARDESGLSWEVQFGSQSFAGGGEVDGRPAGGGRGPLVARTARTGAGSEEGTFADVDHRWRVDDDRLGCGFQRVGGV